jgi:hypothetical protein
MMCDIVYWLSLRRSRFAARQIQLANALAAPFLGGVKKESGGNGTGRARLSPEVDMESGRQHGELIHI